MEDLLGITGSEVQAGRSLSMCLCHHTSDTPFCCSLVY